MKSAYFIPALSYHEECVIKRSRFITYIEHADNRHKAETVIRRLRERHPQSNHVCWAYIAGAPDTTVRSMSDDGEPSGTAGRPILNVLIHSGFGEIVVAVVRYFGGIKLGTGGLVRAYSNAVSEALKNLSTKEKVALQEFTLTMPFAMESDIRYLFETLGATILSCDYLETILIRGSIAVTEYETFNGALINRSGGSVAIQKLKNQ